MDDPVSRIDPEGLEASWLGEMFSDAWQAVKELWDESPQPNAKDAIVGTADAAAKMSEQAGNVASSLQKAGMTTADKVGEALNSPGVKNAGKAVGAVAKGAAGVGIINNAATVVDAFQEVAPRNADLSAIMKRVNAGTMTNEDLLELENRNWGAPIFKGASAAGKAGVSLMTPP